MTTWWSGKPVAEALLQQVRREALAWCQAGVVPTLAVLWTEGQAAARAYARAKHRRAAELGVRVQLHAFPQRATTREWVQTVESLGRDPRIHGILVEMPLDNGVDVQAVIGAIPSQKDVDGLRRTLDTAAPGPLYPATPLAVMRVLTHYGVDLRGREVTLVGCGRTVGRPLLDLLLRAEATVRVCHAATRDVGAHLRTSEIGIVAAGCAGLVTPDMVHPELVLIDVGVNPAPGGGIVGDVAPEAAEQVRAATPVPGGVGMVTTAQLFRNLLDALAIQRPDAKSRMEAAGDTG
jgi:methylenetetrahydrofolate dehydrogenase (NADP+)/methenyltetrahydrofolate cyclohydrolase